MKTLFGQCLVRVAALIFGSGLTCVYALTESDFTNTGIVLSAPTQYENNDNNNDSDVLVKPKGLTVTKQADASAMSTPTKAGDIITYTITLDNIGLLGLNNIQLADSIIPASNVSLTSGDSNDDLILDGDEIWVYTGTYAVTQNDIDSNGGGDGDIDNTVVVSSDELPALQDSAEVPISQSPELSISKRVDQSVISAPGTLNYVIEVLNTGNQSLSGIAPTDTLPDGSPGTLTGPLNDTLQAGFLDVGETWTYQISYAVSQSEIDKGAPLINEVIVTSNETGTEVKSDSAQTTIEKEPAFSVSKEVDSVSIAAPGLLSYNIEVENTGNVSLNNVALVDTLPNGSTGVLVGPIADSGVVGAIDVGETWLYTGTYSATQADIDANADLVNTVNVTADETGTTVQDASARTEVSISPSFTVEKQVDTATLSGPGVLNYIITVENTGNVSLSNVQPVDTLPDGTTATLIGPTADTGLANQLDVGEIWTYTTSYSVSQSEIDSGTTRSNLVQVSSDETGAQVLSDTAATTLTRSPAMTVSKAVDLANATGPGILSYTIVVENTGNTTLTDVQPVDTLPDGSAAILTGPLTDIGLTGVLDVSESWTFTTTYSLSQAEIDAGLALTNTVVVSSNEAATVNADASTTVSQSPSIGIIKSAIETSFSAVGEQLNYTLIVENDGNVQLSNVLVSDPNADAGSLQCAQPMPFSLQPGQQNSCTAIHTVVAADILSTQIDNQASVVGDSPTGDPVEATSEVISLAMTRIPPVATNNSFVATQSGINVTLQAAADDLDANDDLDITTVNLLHPNALDSDGDGDADTVVVAGEGTWVVDNTTGNVTFTPLTGFTADPTPLPYNIQDATDLVSNDALLVIDYPQTAPIAKDDQKSNPQPANANNPTTLNVLVDNGAGPDEDPENDIDVSTINFISSAAVDTDNDGDADLLVVPGEGTWVLDNASGDVTFTPLAGFLLDPTPITYTVADHNGLVSNQALITIDYPQTAPIAVNDEKLKQPLAQPVTLAVVANDSDPENNLDPTSVLIVDPATGDSVATLVVPGEGTWTVNAANGDITFTPEAGFLVAPRPVNYTVKDTTGLESNLALVSVTFEEPAGLEGIVWLDSNRNGEVDGDEQRKAGWTLRVFDDSGVLVATTVTDENGEYSIFGLIPGVFTVQFFNENDVFMDSQTTDGAVQAGQTVNLPLPVDPGGVVYDSLTREPVAGVTLNIVNGSNNLLHADCLAGNQQSQVTADDGLYAFNVLPGAHVTCPADGTYQIQVANTPDEYHPNFSAIIRQAGASDCGDVTLGCAVSSVFDADNNENNCTIDRFPNTQACEVQQQPDAPVNADDTTYYVEFFLQSGDRNVIFNHLPLDARVNDASILLSKSVNRRSVSIGGFARYTLIAENTKEAPAVDLTIVDLPPAGFGFISQSVVATRAGEDGVFDTEDDTSLEITVVDEIPIEFSKFDLNSFERVRIEYLMRVGVGVVSGAYSNKASVSGPNGEASNVVSATVTIEPDPVLNQATLIGKVFNDRDEDGNQDPADATGVAMRSDFYGWNSLRLPPLPGRTSIDEDPAGNAITVNMPVSESNRFQVVTREGTRISVDDEGTITEAHVGEKARGLNSQDIRVCTRYTHAVMTDQQGRTEADGAVEPVLQVVIANHGINEEGIPGVRLATVTGLLIETDGYGRFNIPDVDAGTTGIGQNFVLKVDKDTLPIGSEFTTENPYVLRILNSSLNKINFGVKVPEVDQYASHVLCGVEEDAPISYRTIEVSLGSVFFDTDRHDIRQDQVGIVRDIINKLREYGGGEILVEAHTDSRGDRDYNIKLAEKRANTIREVLRSELGEALMEQISVAVDPAAFKEQEK